MGGKLQFYKPTLQTKFGEQGNCLSAVIATLFDVHIDEVPLFADYDDKWVLELSTWMAQKFNKYVMPVSLEAHEQTELFCDSLMITFIDSPNPDVDRHAVISIGDKIVFDPMIGEVDQNISQSQNPHFLVIGDILNR